MHKLPDGVRIPSIEALNDAIADGNIGFAICLNGGVYSRKQIVRRGKKYHVVNYVDGSMQTLTAKQLFNASFTNVGRAITLGALFTLQND